TLHTTHWEGVREALEFVIVVHQIVDVERCTLPDRGELRYLKVCRTQTGNISVGFGKCRQGINDGKKALTKHLQAFTHDENVVVAIDELRCCPKVNDAC